MKKLVSLLLSLSLALGLAACGNGNSANSPAPGTDTPAPGSSAPAQTGSGSAEGVKVAMSMSGPISDMSWNYTGYMGLKLMEEEGAEITYQENVDPASIVETFRTYASEGYDMVYINDDSNQEDVVTAAADFPNTQVFICNGANHTDNVYPIYFADEDHGFIMGLIAGLLTKTDKIGFVGGLEFTPIIHCAQGFEQGVKYVNPDAEVVITYIGSMTDVAAAKETAAAMFQSGCDVVVPNADAASLGVIEAGEEAGGMTVACGEGMESVGPTTCAAGVRMDTSVGYKAAFDQVISGTLPKVGEAVQKFGIADGLVLEPTYNDGFTAGELTDEMKAAIQAGYDALKSGEVSVQLAD